VTDGEIAGFVISDAGLSPGVPALLPAASAALGIALAWVGVARLRRRRS